MQFTPLSFDQMIEQSQDQALLRSRLETLQVNVGKRCNMACLHCHVEAGPKRTEEMSSETADLVIELLQLAPCFRTLDLTGGAPELNPHFRRLVKAASALGCRVIDRCNLSILFEPQQHDLANFLAEQEVEITASLPCYLEDNVEQQRGKGSFSRSIEGLRLLNQHGYGQEGGELILNLVYNPIGAMLPPSQSGLEEAYRRELWSRYQIKFNHLLTITNMPIKRFGEQLSRRGDLGAYYSLLFEHFNPQTLQGLMCKSLISVGWDGQLYDCDFNQMLELPLGFVKELSDLVDLARISPLDRLLDHAQITTGDHCFGCTAGAGSSCGGALS